ncbi:MAG: flagellar hook-associated protein FlgK [Planctomycetota bacterium]
MSLTSTLSIGRTALTASQLGLQVAGNNLANATTPGYTRQSLLTSPAGGQRFGQGIAGLGVQVEGIRREINESVQARLRLGIADEQAARARLEMFSAVEATLGEFTGSSVTSELDSFFNSFSELANLVGSESLVIQEAATLAGQLSATRSRLLDQQNQIDDEIGASITRANAILTDLATVNAAIIGAESGLGQDGNLRDQRDQLLSDLSELMDVTVTELPGGGVDVLVGSTPVLLGGQSLGLDLETEVINGQIEITVALAQTGRDLNITGGRIGGLIDARERALGDTIDSLDAIAGQLIRQVNELQVTGASENGLTLAQGTLALAIADQTVPLSDPSLASVLPWSVSNGNFSIRVTNPTTLEEQLVPIEVDLDGLNGDDTTAAAIVAQLDAIDGITASFAADGTLRVEAAAGWEFGFEDDSSGFLAAFGVNSFFTGTNASDIAVNENLEANPSLLRVGRMVDGELVSNGTALAIADLANLDIEALGDQTMIERWSASTQAVGNRTNAAITETEAAELVRQSLEAERAALSGVSTDEESINLIEFQTAYEAAARLISITDELLDTLLSLV